MSPAKTAAVKKNLIHKVVVNPKKMSFKIHIVSSTGDSKMLVSNKIPFSESKNVNIRARNMLRVTLTAMGRDG